MVDVFIHKRYRPLELVGRPVESGVDRDRDADCNFTHSRQHRIPRSSISQNSPVRAGWRITFRAKTPRRYELKTSGGGRS